MDQPYTVGQYLVDRLTQIGLKHLFSIAGDYSIEWLNNYVQPSTIELIEEVNELNAGYAADGYARFAGIGALCCTYSAGSLCAVNAIAGAYVEKVPVVLINGTPSIKKTLTFEQTGYSAHHFISGRQTDLQVFEYITAAAIRVDQAELAPPLIDYALMQCLTSRQPVYIELLQDVVNQQCAPPLGLLQPARVLSDPDSLKQSLETVGAAVASAARPLIWLGPEIDRYRLQDKTAALVHRLNVRFATQLLSKSVLSEDDPLFLGVLDGQASSPAVLQDATDSDMILALGVWLTDINSLGWEPDLNCTAFASFDTIKYGTTFNAQVALEDFIDGLLAAAAPHQPPTVAPTVPDRPAPNPLDQITYQGFYDFIGDYVDADTIVGSDASMNYFGSILLKVPGQGGFVAQSSYSAIGYIGPAATGICLATGGRRKVMVLSGDGGFQITVQCLSTQTRFRLSPIVFVINNGVYGVEQWLANPSIFASGGPFYDSCKLHPWDYGALADVFGCQGWQAHTYEELADAIQAALSNSDGPSLIEVVVPSHSIPENADWATSAPANQDNR